MKTFCFWATLFTSIVVALAFHGSEAVWADVRISGEAMVRTRLRLDKDKVKDETATNSYNMYRFGVNVKAPISDAVTLGCRLSSESPANYISMGKGTDNLPEVQFQYAYLRWKIKNKVTFTGGRFPYKGGFLADLHFKPTIAASGPGPVDNYFALFHAGALEGFMCSVPLVKGDTDVDIEFAASSAVERFGTKGEDTEHDSYDCILAAPITALKGTLKIRPSVAVRTTADEKSLDSMCNLRITGGAAGSFALNQTVSTGFGVGYSTISTDSLDNHTLAFSMGPSVKGLGPGNLNLRFDMAIYSEGDNTMTNPFVKVDYFIPFKDKVVLDFLYRMYMKKTEDDAVDWMRNQFDVTLKANL